MPSPNTDDPPALKRLWLPATFLFLLLSVLYVFSIDLRATRSASIGGDEPFYLMTTQSLLDDGDLDLRNQYAARSYVEYLDTPSGLWYQSVPAPNGQLLSPHEPGLSLLVIPGFLIDGLRGAQVKLLLLASLTFSLVFILCALETGRLWLTWLITLGVALSATAFVYATEIYPEAPAALCVVLALLLIRAGRRTPAFALLMALDLTALCWLGEKYVPLAAVIGLFYLAGADKKTGVSFVVLGAVSGIAYIWAHLVIYGSLSAYSVNTVYENAASTTVLADHLGAGDRVYRLWGLFIDRRFGIGRWAPLLLLVPVALPLLLRRSRVANATLAIVVAQILIATFLAITMMGYWFPGRTLVTVLPLFALPLTLLLARFPALGLPAVLLASATGVQTVGLVLDTHDLKIALASDPFAMTRFMFQETGALFPQYTAWGLDTWLLTAVWLGIALVASVFLIAPNRPAFRLPRPLRPRARAGSSVDLPRRPQA